MPCNSNEFRDNDVSPRLTFPSAYGGVKEETDEGIQNTTGRYCISDNEDLTIQRAASVTSAPRNEFSSVRPPLRWYLIPLFTFAFRTREGIQLRHAVLQDTLPGQQEGRSIRRRHVSTVHFLSILSAPHLLHARHVIKCRATKIPRVKVAARSSPIRENYSRARVRPMCSCRGTDSFLIPVIKILRTVNARLGDPAID